MMMMITNTVDYYEFLFFCKIPTMFFLYSLPFYFFFSSN